MRPGKAVFRFAARRIACASSEGGWGRFTRLTLFLKKDKTYLLHVFGGSPRSEDDELHRWIMCLNAHDVVKVLRLGRGKDKSHSKIAKELLRLASIADVEFKKDWKVRHGHRKARGQHQDSEGRNVPVRQEARDERDNPVVP